jgi:hypothetical protein
MLPFSHEQFLATFAEYNQAVWPAQVLAYALGFGAGACLVRTGAWASRMAAGALVLMWLWTGVVYHGLFFSRVNPAAYVFGAAFAVEAMLLGFAAWRGSLRLGTGRGGMHARIGWTLIAYALVGYPMVGALSGMTYPHVPVFGITPCPLTLFTFGVLLESPARVPWWLLGIPLAWSLIGGSAAAILQVPQDWPLLFSAVAAVMILVGQGHGATLQKPGSAGRQGSRHP